ncbi:MAG: hypothetical protein PHI31_02190 [Desulfuromonadaceae bacterium]|nr:hypothetical protein [Desulfuromonadaceae bacterium]
MAVVINDFEVIPEVPRQNQTETTSSAAPTSFGATAHELRLMMLKIAEREARIRTT